MNAKEKLRQWLNDSSNMAYSELLFRRLTSQYTTGEIAELKRNRQIFRAIEKIAEKSMKDKEYSAAIIPTYISSGKARNFLFLGEEEPTEDEIFSWFYLLFSSVRWGNYLINLINIDESLKENFRKRLIGSNIITSSGRVDMGEIKRLSGININIPSKSHIISFAFLNFFMAWHKRMKLIGEAENEFHFLGIDDLFAGWEITDETTLVLINTAGKGGKKEMYFIPKIKSFLYEWYNNFFDNPEIKYPPLGRFIFSLYIADRNYRDKSSGLLNKFLYYLLRGHVNGDLLDKLLLLKIDYELSPRQKEKRFGVLDTYEFFQSLK